MSDDYVTFEVKGLAELQEKLEALPEKLARTGIKKALKAGANPIREAMVATAPVNVGDIRFPPRYLADHLGTKIKMSREGLAGTAFIGPNAKAEYPLYQSGAFKIIRKANGKIKKVGRIAVMTVARWLEFGTKKMGKRPFMTQAFESNKFQALEAITETLSDAVEKL